MLRLTKESAEAADVPSRSLRGESPLVTSGIAIGNKKLLVASGITTRNKDATSNKGHRY